MKEKTEDSRQLSHPIYLFMPSAQSRTGHKERPSHSPAKVLKGLTKKQKVKCTSHYN